MALDSDIPTVFFNIQAQTIVISTEILRFIHQHDKTKSATDQLAYILAHELEHAFQKTPQKIIYSTTDKFLNGWRNQIDLEEELRADREALNRMARGGYNPQAAIQILESFGLTTGHQDSSHPEGIERLRAIEKVLIDDENPLPNCGIPFQDVNKQVLEAINNCDYIYEKTNRLLPQNLAEAQANLLKTSSLNDFLSIWAHIQHLLMLQKSNYLLEQFDFSELSINLLKIQALYNQARRDSKDNPQTMTGNHVTAIRNSLIPYLNPDGTTKLSGIVNPDYDPSDLRSEKYEPVFEANNFRSRIAETKKYELTTAQENLIKFKKLAKSNLAKDDLNSYITPDTFPQLWELLQKIQSDKITEEELMRRAFPDLDRDSKHNRQVFLDQKLQKAGRRSSDELNPAKLHDLGNKKIRGQFIENIQQQISISSQKDPPSLDESQKNHLTKLLKKEINDDSIVELLISVLLNESDASLNWREEISQLPKSQLAPLIKNLKSLPYQKIIRLSPNDPDHISYQSSLNRLPSFNYEIDNQYQFKINNQLIKKGFKGLVWELLWIYYLKSYPTEKKDYIHTFKRHSPPQELDLSFADWKMLDETENQIKDPLEISFFRLPRQRMALQELINHHGRREELASDYQFMLKHLSVNSLDIGSCFKWADILILLSNNWFDKKTLNKLTNSILETITAYSIKQTPDNYGVGLQILTDKYRLLCDQGSSINESSPYLNRIIGFEINIQHKSLASILTELSSQNLPVSIYYLDKHYKPILAQLNSEKLSKIPPIWFNQFGIDIQKLLLHSPHEKWSRILEECIDYRMISQSIKDLFMDILQQSDLKTLSLYINDIITNAFLKDQYWLAIQESLAKNNNPIPTIAIDQFITGKNLDTASRTKAFFDYLEYGSLKKAHYLMPQNSLINQERLEKRYHDTRKRGACHYNYKGTGRQGREFSDLALRRHSFSELSQNYRQTWQSFDFSYDRSGPVSLETALQEWHQFGNPTQFWESKKLLDIEPLLFDPPTEWEKQISLICSTAQYPSSQRDIYLEYILRDELSKNLTPKNQIKVLEKVLPLFRENSDLIYSYAVIYLETLFLNNSDLLKDIEKGQTLIIRYLKEASLARNYFLDKLVENVPVTPSQIEQIESLKMTNEGSSKEKKDKSDSMSPWALLYDRLSEMSRPERVKTILWLLNIPDLNNNPPEKPLEIIKLEQDYDGHADSFPKLFNQLTPPEKSQTINRLCLGTEGILDLEALNNLQIPQAINERSQFLTTLINHFFSDDIPPNPLFRKIMKKVFTEAPPSKGSLILARLVNKLSSSVLAEKKLQPAELVCFILAEFGVIGKKVAQALSEFSWVPSDYRQYLEIYQEQADKVPKKALKSLAETSGLLNGIQGIKIISWDKLIGSASNKQAALVTVEVLDENKTDLKKGQYQLILKAKRPSAQKSPSLSADIQLIQSVLGMVQEEGIRMPESFLEGIINAVQRELQFSKEVDFAKLLKDDLKKRNKKLNWSIEVPDIYFSNNDLVLESIAKGSSYKERIRDISPEQQKIINQRLVTEILAQILIYGNLHADLHPGNCFIADNLDITLIDLGMNEQLDPTEKMSIFKLSLGLIIGNNRQVSRSLKKMGWSIPESQLNLINIKINLQEKKLENVFMKNVNILLDKMRDTKAIPAKISLIITALSKLEIYLQGLSKLDLQNIFKDLNKLIEKKFDYFPIGIESIKAINTIIHNLIAQKIFLSK